MNYNSYLEWYGMYTGKGVKQYSPEYMIEVFRGKNIQLRNSTVTYKEFWDLVAAEILPRITKPAVEPRNEPGSRD